MNNVICSPGQLARVPALALIVCCVSSTVIGQQANTSARSNQSIAEMKSEVLLDAFEEALLDQSIDEVALENLISRAPSQHIQQTASREMLAKSAKERFAALVQAGIDDVYQKVNRDQDHDLVSRDWLLQRLEAIRPGKLAEAERLAMNRFDDSYSKARAAVVQKQWIEVSPLMQGLSLDARQIERASTGSDVRSDALAVVKARLKTAGWAGRLFEENETLLTNSAEDLIRRGLQELDAQKRMLAVAEVKGASTPRIAANLRSALREYVKTAHGSYDVFPSVEAFIEPRASALMKTRFQTMLQPEKVTSLYQDETLRKAILDDPSAHRVRADSTGLLYKKLLPVIQTDVVTAHFAEQQEPLQGHLSEFQQMLEQEPYRNQLELSLRQSLERRTPGIRVAIGVEQIRTAFGGLGTRLPDEDAIDWYKTMGSQAQLADLVEKLGYSSAQLSPLIEEAASQLSTQTRQIFTEGRDALDAQLAIAESQRPMIDQWHRSGKDRDEAFLTAKRAVSVLWGQRRNKYADLFHRTEKRMAEIVELVYSVPVPVEVLPEPVTTEKTKVLSTPVTFTPAEKISNDATPPRTRKDAKETQKAKSSEPSDGIDVIDSQASERLPQVPKSMAEQMDTLKSEILAAQNSPNFDLIKQHLKAIEDLLHPRKPGSLPQRGDQGILTAALDRDAQPGLSLRPSAELAQGVNGNGGGDKAVGMGNRPGGAGAEPGSGPSDGNGNGGGDNAAGLGRGPGGAGGGPGSGPGGGNGNGGGDKAAGLGNGPGGAGGGPGSGPGGGNGNGGDKAAGALDGSGGLGAGLGGGRHRGLGNDNADDAARMGSGPRGGGTGPSRGPGRESGDKNSQNPASAGIPGRRIGAGTGGSGGDGNNNLNGESGACTQRLDALQDQISKLSRELERYRQKM